MINPNNPTTYPKNPRTQEPKNPNIVFFGSGYYTIPIVEKLKNRGLKLVVTTEKEGKLINYLKSKKISFIGSKLNNNGDINKIKELNPSLGVLASYGAIIPSKLLSLFPQGILNIHPSLLPRYKGPSPVQYTILNGDRQTGVTIIKLDDKVDHGPIILQEKIALNGNETLKNLSEKLFALGADMIEKVVQKLQKGLALEEKQQDHSKEIFTEKVSKQDGMIDLEKISTNPLKIGNKQSFLSDWKLEITRKIRAYYPWPGLWFRANVNGAKRIVKLLPNEKIQVEGKKIMSFKDFANGYPEGHKILDKLSLREA